MLYICLNRVLCIINVFPGVFIVSRTNKASLSYCSVYSCERFAFFICIERDTGKCKTSSLLAIKISTSKFRVSQLSGLIWKCDSFFFHFRSAFIFRNTFVYPFITVCLFSFFSCFESESFVLSLLLFKQIICICHCGKDMRIHNAFPPEMFFVRCELTINSFVRIVFCDCGERGRGEWNETNESRFRIK